MNEKSNWTPCGGGWFIDLSQEAALHESGFRLDFSGHPSSRNFDVQPSGLPQNVGAVEWARLLREGTDEYRRAYARDDTSGYLEEEESIEAAPRDQTRKPIITVKRKRQIG